jgi:hypothetical protein
MSEDKSNIEDAINAVSGLVEKVPVYQDAIQPLAKETGKALGTVGRAVNAALMPIRGLVWGIEQIEVFIQCKLAEKLKNVSPEDIQTPDPAVAGPAIESLRFTGHKEDIAELYANLLATSMNKSTARSAHPGFVGIIRNLSGDEARILSFMAKVHVIPVVDIRKAKSGDSSWMTVRPYVSTIEHDAGCEHRDLTATYIKNLERLGLIDIPPLGHLTPEEIYDRILNDPPVKKIEDDLNALEGYKASFKKYYVRLSELGELFVAACVDNKDKA